MENQAEETRCDECGKPEPLCRCGLTPLASRLKLLILQHPRETTDERSTAPILSSLLPGARTKVGLSCRNLVSAWGESFPAGDWAVLYLGSGVQKRGDARLAPLTLVSRKGAALEETEQAARLKRLKGLVVLDGTWSQAKSLWWRNAWLLKLQRVILNPVAPSLYGKDRHEPRKECLSTLESVALWLEHTGEPETARRLREELSRFLEDYRKWRATSRRPAAAELPGTPR